MLLLSFATLQFFLGLEPESPKSRPPFTSRARSSSLPSNAQLLPSRPLSPSLSTCLPTDPNLNSSEPVTTLLLLLTLLVNKPTGEEELDSLPVLATEVLLPSVSITLNTTTNNNLQLPPSLLLREAR